MKEHLANVLKGFAMGAANVVPGVSGGTIAFITGIYERLIEALKSFDLEAVKLAAGFKFKELWKKVDGGFLAALGGGVILAFASLAKILKWGFSEYPVLIWALFFGLIAASIPSLAKVVTRWRGPAAITFIIGLIIAVSMAFLEPANPNDNVFYLGACGVAAMCSMIIPGLSGSFVLLLMGNYELIMLNAISDFFDGEIGKALPILIPVGIGAVVGLLILSRFLSWLFKTHHDAAVGAITGFVVGSLVIIWPWKTKITETFIKDGETKTKIVGFKDWRLPDLSSSSVWGELLALVVGVVLILAVERFAKKSQKGS